MTSLLSFRKKPFSEKRYPTLRCINCLVTVLYTQKSNLSLQRSKFRSLNRWKRTRLTSKRQQTFRLSAISSRTWFCLTISVASIWSLPLKISLFRYSIFKLGLVCTSSTSRLKICNAIELPTFWVKTTNVSISNSNQPSSPKPHRTPQVKWLNFSGHRQSNFSHKGYLCPSK